MLEGIKDVVSVELPDGLNNLAFSMLARVKQVVVEKAHN